MAVTLWFSRKSRTVTATEVNLGRQEEGEERFLLGTDDQGRDILSTMLYGARLSLTIGFLAVAVQLFLEPESH